MTDDKEPVKIELGASAKLEVKTEVPSHASGRFVHAVLDAVSPLSEWLGLQGDKVRIHRHVAVQKLLRKAEEELAEDQRPIHPVPTKTAVRLIEHASLEDPDDDQMISLWAKLLASSATTDRVSPRFISLLSEMNARQADLLTAIYNHPLGHYTSVHELLDKFLMTCERDKDNLPTRAAVKSLSERLGPGLTDVTAIIPKDGRRDHLPLFTAEYHRVVDLDILDSLGVTDFSDYTSSSVNNLSLTVQRATITFLGDELLLLVGVATEEELGPP